MIFFMVISTVFFIVLGIWSIIRKMNCKREIQGTFVGKYCRRSYYIPIFCYEFESCQYESYTFDILKKREVKRYIEEEKYNIFINEKKPKDFVVDRRLKLGDFYLLGFGLLSFFLTAVILFVKLDLYIDLPIIENYVNLI